MASYSITHTPTHTHTDTQTHAHTHIRTHRHTHIYTLQHTSTRTYTHTQTSFTYQDGELFRERKIDGKRNHIAQLTCTSAFDHVLQFYCLHRIMEFNGAATSTRIAQHKCLAEDSNDFGLLNGERNWRMNTR